MSSHADVQRPVHAHASFVPRAHAHMHAHAQVGSSAATVGAASPLSTPAPAPAPTLVTGSFLTSAVGVPPHTHAHFSGPAVPAVPARSAYGGLSRQPPQASSHLASPAPPPAPSLAQCAPLLLSHTSAASFRSPAAPSPAAAASSAYGVPHPSPWAHIGSPAYGGAPSPNGTLAPPPSHVAPSYAAPTAAASFPAPRAFAPGSLSAPMPAAKPGLTPVSTPSLIPTSGASTTGGGAPATGSSAALCPRSGHTRRSVIESFIRRLVDENMLTDAAATALMELFDTSWASPEEARDALLAFTRAHTGTKGVTVATNRHRVAGANSSNRLSIVYCAGWLHGTPDGPVKQDELTCRQHFAFRCSEADERWRLVVDMEKLEPRMNLAHGPLCTRPAGGQQRVVDKLLSHPAIMAAASATVPLTHDLTRSMLGTSASSSSIGRALARRMLQSAHAGGYGIMSFLQQHVNADSRTRVGLLARDTHNALGHGVGALVRVTFAAQVHAPGGASGVGAAAAAEGASAAGAAGGAGSADGAGAAAVARAAGARAGSPAELVVEQAVDACNLALASSLSAGEAFRKFGELSQNLSELANQGVHLLDASGNPINEADLVFDAEDALEKVAREGSDTDDEEATSGCDGASLVSAASSESCGGGALKSRAITAAFLDYFNDEQASGAALASSTDPTGASPPPAHATGASPPPAHATGAMLPRTAAPSGTSASAGVAAARTVPCSAQTAFTVDSVVLINLAQERRIDLELVALSVEPGRARWLQACPVVTSAAADFSYFRSPSLSGRFVLGIVAMSVDSCKVGFVSRVTVWAGNESEVAWDHLLDGALDTAVTAIADACNIPEGEYARVSGCGIIAWTDGEKGAATAMARAIARLPERVRRFVVHGRCTKHIERNLRATLGTAEFHAGFGQDAADFWGLVDAADGPAFASALNSLRERSVAAFDAIVRVNNPRGDVTVAGAGWAQHWFAAQNCLTYGCRTSNLVEMMFSALAVLGARTAHSPMQCLSITMDFSNAAVDRVVKRVRARQSQVLLETAHGLYNEQHQLAVTGQYRASWTNKLFGMGRVNSGEKDHVVDLRKPHSCTSCDGVKHGVPCRHRLALKFEGEVSHARLPQLSAQARSVIDAATRAVETGNANVLAQCMRTAGAAVLAADVTSVDKDALEALILAVSWRALGRAAADAPLPVTSEGPALLALPAHGRLEYFERNRVSRTFFWVHEFAPQQHVRNFGDLRLVDPIEHAESPSLDAFLAAPEPVDSGVFVLGRDGVITRSVGRQNRHARMERRVCHQCGIAGHNRKSCTAPAGTYMHRRVRPRDIKRRRREAAASAAHAVPANAVIGAGGSAAGPGAYAAEGHVAGAGAAGAQAAGVAAPSATGVAGEPMNGNEGAASGKVRGPRNCKNCGQPGHYQKTCPHAAREETE